MCFEMDATGVERTAGVRAGVLKGLAGIGCKCTGGDVDVDVIVNDVAASLASELCPDSIAFGFCWDTSAIPTETDGTAVALGILFVSSPSLLAVLLFEFDSYEKE